MPPLSLARIPADSYTDYRYDVIFGAYKWDPQVFDHNTVSRYVLLLDRKTADLLQAWAEQLSLETMRMEEALLDRPRLAKALGLPQDIRRALYRHTRYEREKNVRLMRFDFHPTPTGWAVSEVNSDVPGGFAEAAVLPRFAAPFFPDCRPHETNIAASLLSAFEKRIAKGGTVALVHATSYADDRQVMQFVGDYFSAHGMNTVFAAPDHIAWTHGRAAITESGQKIDGILRFFPLEWLTNLPKKSQWRGYYDCETPSCNHPVAILTQSKRLPLVWDGTNVPIPAWKKLLPETVAPSARPPADGWIVKPALGRVGEGISIKEAISKKELASLEKSAKRHPKDWILQKRFESLPLPADDKQAFHLCVGAFTVDGKGAGFYGRISPYPRIDANAQDIPVLIRQE
jgi:glutathionylspermidine synthase